MAFSVKRSLKRSRGTQAVALPDGTHIVPLDAERVPDQIVVVTAHSFGGGLKLVVLGALAGAGATYFLLQKRAPAAARSAGEDAVAAGLSAGGAKGDSRALLGRLSSLAGRLKNVAGSVKGVAQFATDTVGPAVTAAVSEGRKTAREVEEELRRDLEEAEREAAEAAKAAREEREKKHDND